MTGKVVSVYTIPPMLSCKAGSRRENAEMPLQVAITGAASGIGRATAELLASEGALLSLCDRNADGLQATLDLLSGPAGSHITVEVDVSSAPAVNKWIERTVQHFGKLDGAVNSAGVCPVDPVPIRVATDERWDYVMSINTTGIFYCLRAQLQQMQSGGSIVNVASIAGHVGLAGSASYAASKHAVIGLTKTAAREEGDAGIRVNCVTPGRAFHPVSSTRLLVVLLMFHLLISCRRSRPHSPHRSDP